MDDSGDIIADSDGDDLYDVLVGVTDGITFDYQQLTIAVSEYLGRVG